MTARVRIVAIVAIVSVSAATVTVGAAILQSDGAPAAPAAASRPSGAPPLMLDLGVRSDAEAQALRRATALYDRGRRREALAVFDAYRSVEAEVGTAIARWPDGTVTRLQGLAWANPRSGLVRLNLGFALFWAGRRDEALVAWRAARRIEPDSLAAVRADDLLHPNFAHGQPTFVPGFDGPAALAKLSPEQQLERLQEGAETSSGSRARAVEWKLLYGVALQRLGRPLSALHQFDAAAALEPAPVEAQVAAAVGRFDKGHPERAFSRLGPLAKRFPREPSVRFHLGLLLLWSGEVEEAKRQLSLASAAGKGKKLGREADRLLDRLLKIRTD